MKTKTRTKTSIRTRLEQVIRDMFLYHQLKPTVANVKTVIEGMGANDAYWRRLAKEFEPGSALLAAAKAKTPSKGAKKPVKPR